MPRVRGSERRRPAAGAPALLQAALLAALTAAALGACGPPPNLLFASPLTPLNETDYEAGTRLKYTCRPGYTRVSSHQYMTCQPSGDWHHTTFCTKKRCQNPGELQNGHVLVKTDLLFGAQLEFTCLEGYLLIGSNTSYCELQDSGVDWSDPLPECVIAKCSPPPAIAHGRHNGRDQVYTFGSSVTYSCSPTFSMLGAASISCTVENRTISVWSPSPPVCKKVSCPYPEIKDGKVASGFRQSYAYRDSVSLACREGFLLRGSSLLRCGADSKWDLPLPTCELNSCVGRPDIPHSSWVVRPHREALFTVGTVLQYDCHRGYRPVGGGHTWVKCQEDLSWTLPTLCEDVELLMPQDRAGVPEETPELWELVTRLGVPPAGGRGQTCCRPRSGPPEQPLEACCPVPELKNGVVAPPGRRQYRGSCAYFPGDKLSYSCFETIFSATCQQDGTWLPREPTCDNTCHFPPAIAHGRHELQPYTLFREESVIYSCDSGYQLVGEKTLHCRDSRWSSEAPKCRAQCPPPAVGNGHLSVDKRQYLEPETLSVQCDPGYEMVGSPNITCLGDRTWGPAVPQCKWVFPEGCESVAAGSRLLQCLPNSQDVKLALEVYKLFLEIDQLEQQRSKGKEPVLASEL
ncbi:C4b-binding protein alpha chain [Galemys pyrenaicus]|uniref:C4b-binding protein alpha chain n=1 Tax=Galemys pyrenaicus TaxID=202257 RepID=A0A8J5ZLY5_GALPY|nr:C4b-binding protein alpha chain [Galemys pyrenaicus]